MSNSRSQSRSSLTIGLALAALAAACHPAAQAQSTSQFIGNVENQISAVTASFPVGNTKPLVFGGEDILLLGFQAAMWTPQEEIDYLDGMKAAGVQRLEFNPAVTAINNPVAMANFDLAVRHARQLGMLIAINPSFNNGEFIANSFSDFTAVAMQTYPALAARYQPDNFVIVHEPTTQTARMGITATPDQWVQFINAVEPLIKQASPHTLVGAGDCSHCNESDYFDAFVVIPNCTLTNLSVGCTDFVTDDDYSDSLTDFVEVEGWTQLAHANNKPMYMEETSTPHDLPPGSTLGGYQGSPTGAEGASLVGTCDTVFETLNQNWLAFMAQFDMAYGLESMTAFTTQTFFLYVSAPAPLDQATNSTYLKEMAAYVSSGTPQLTSTGTAFNAEVQQYGVKMATSIPNASYATLPTIFNPTCGTSGNPCNPNSIVAPDTIVSAFGADLANTTVPATAWNTDLGGTTATLVDSANNSYQVLMDFVSPYQMNYLIPADAAPGPAVLTITSGDLTVTTSVVLVAPVSPGIYTYFSNGQGTAAAIAVCSGTCSDPAWVANPAVPGQFFQNTFAAGCAQEPCTAPLRWGTGDAVVIEFFGTGIRHVAALSDVSAIVGSTSLQVQYAGAQSTYPGLDQINVAIPQSLNGAGKVSLTLSVQYTDATTKQNYTSASNTVTLDLE